VGGARGGFRFSNLRRPEVQGRGFWGLLPYREKGCAYFQHVRQKAASRQHALALLTTPVDRPNHVVTGIHFAAGAMRPMISVPEPKWEWEAGRTPLRFCSLRRQDWAASGSEVELRRGDEEMRSCMRHHQTPQQQQQQQQANTKTKYQTPNMVHWRMARGAWCGHHTAMRYAIWGMRCTGHWELGTADR
jgi:hypothetical protein